MTLARQSGHANEHPVIGADISGLTAAHALARAGHDVVVLDRRQGPGGRFHTERRDGFLVEHGPNSMISPAPGAESLIDSLGLDTELLDYVFDPLVGGLYASDPRAAECFYAARRALTGGRFRREAVLL